MAEVHAISFSAPRLRVLQGEERQNAGHAYKLILPVSNSPVSMNNENNLRIHLPLDGMPQFHLDCLTVEEFRALVRGILNEKDPNLERLFGEFVDAYLEFEDHDR